MKNKLFVFPFLLLCFFSFSASAEKPQCRYTELYESAGWKIHDSNHFLEIQNQVLANLKSGLDSGSIIFDISGPIRTKDTLDQQEILLDAIMWDDKTTNDDLMLGDIAIMYVAEKESKVKAEVRWFDGNQRNIVINPEILTCFSEEPPHAYNSVL